MDSRWQIKVRNTAKAGDTEPFTVEVYVEGELRHTAGPFADGGKALTVGREWLQGFRESEESASLEPGAS